MMKIKPVFALIALISFVLPFSCNKPEEDDPRAAISLSLTSAEYAHGGGREVSVEVTARGEWHVEGLTEGVRNWISVTPESGIGNATVTIACIAANVGDIDRYAVVDFVCGEQKKSFVAFQHCLRLNYKTISWAASISEDTIFAPEGAAYAHFPYANSTSWKTVTTITDGLNGALIVEDKVFSEEREYIFNGTTLKIGGYSPTESFYYYPKSYSSIRLKKAYICIPAIEGYKLIGVKAVSKSGTSKNCFVLSAREDGTEVLDGMENLAFGVPDPVDVAIVSAREDTPYYMVVTDERNIASFEFRFEEVVEE